MHRDFTCQIYKQLLTELKKNKFQFLTFHDYLEQKININKIIILRHDIDRKPDNALNIAQIENELEIKASYYFRITRTSFNQTTIKRIISLGHEIGYHYEDLSFAKGNFKKAIKNFETNLKLFRKLYPMKTICMHGSPLSKWDNRLIWTKINYKDYGIIGEPYFDIDFTKFSYLTDTGRKWNDSISSIRDKVKNSKKLHFNSTGNIINALKNNKFPNFVLMNTHPQRWTDNNFPWLNELISQSLKNQIKKVLNKFNTTSNNQ